MNRRGINKVDIWHIFDVMNITGSYSETLEIPLDRLLIDFSVVYFLTWGIALKNDRNVGQCLGLTMKVRGAVTLNNHD